MSDARQVLEPLRTAGVLTLGELHVAATLARLGHVDRPEVVLAAALAARAPRLGHTCIDLTTVVDSIVTERDEDIRAVGTWPEPAAWRDAVQSSPLVDGEASPLVLEGTRLYLRRYWAYERAVADQLAARAAQALVPVTPSAEVLDALLTGEGSDRQRAGVQSALAHPLTVLVGGPGTGKTTTVAAVLASLVVHDPSLRIALAAPTGKAAARLAEALREAAARWSSPVAERLHRVEASTLHRLLGSRAGSLTRFRHDQHHPLAHDVVIVDETSMVSLPLMAHLLDAVRPTSRLVLVGDSGQLASVEAGTVLGDIAGPYAELDHEDPEVTDGPGSVAPLDGHVVVLRHSRRFPSGCPIDRLARAIRAGDTEAALATLADPDAARATTGALAWFPVSGDQGAAVAQVLALAVPAADDVCRRAAAGDATGALRALGELRVLCAHRVGPFGVERWNRHLETGLARAGRPSAGWYPGRPLLVTANDYVNGLFNGDLGVVVVEGQRRLVAFADGDGVRLLGPSRLQAVETVHAMTIHKSQGSEFDHVVVVLPPAGSPLASRELLYTAVTRARQRVTVVGDEASVRAAIERRIVRVGGLRDRLWPSGRTHGV
jgi:exodeoxyribonuclease V alpha subunit